MEAQPEPDNQKKPEEKPKNGEDEEPEQEGDGDYETMTPEAPMRKEPANVDSLVRRLSLEQVPVHVHDIIIRGTTRTNDTVIESEVAELLRRATTFQELRHAAGVAEERLRGLGIFKSVNVTLDAGPQELPGTANVVIEVSEPSIDPYVGELRSFPKSWAGSYEGTGKLKSLFGCGDVSDAAVGYVLVLIGILPDLRRLHSISLEVELLHAIPLGFCGTALKLGVSAGVVCPWRFFRGGNFSPVSSLGGPFSVQGFRARGMGPAEPRRVIRDNMNNDGNLNDSGVDHVCGNLAFRVGAFADLSFKLPLKVLRNAGIHGHVFGSTDGLNLLDNAYRGSFRDAVGVGVTLTTRLFRMEVNYCHVFKQRGHDHGKTGIEFRFSTSW